MAPDERNSLRSGGVSGLTHAREWQAKKTPLTSDALNMPVLNRRASKLSGRKAGSEKRNDHAGHQEHLPRHVRYFRPLFGFPLGALAVAMVKAYLRMGYAGIEFDKSIALR
jgi:hypothetical protein